MTPTGAREAAVSAGIDPSELVATVRSALEEDLRWGPDATSIATVAARARADADIAARSAGVVAGIPVLLTVAEVVGLGPVAVHAGDSAPLDAGDRVASVGGPLRALLGAERTILNFLTHLAGVATATRAWVDAVAGTGAQIRDTRKTIPGLRSLEKYAVRCGGGVNHRMGLGDAALIKDNHVLAAGSVTAAMDAVRAEFPALDLEVECDTLEQVAEALDAGAGLILLDNMTIEETERAVSLRRGHPAARFESSGGLTLGNARRVAECGVDYLAVGALTHSARALDLGLDLRQEP